MLIVDSQVHIWAPNTPERPWPARQAPHRAVPITAEELLREMDAAGVARTVIVPPSWEGDRNDLALAAAQAHPQRFAVMGRLDPLAPQSRARVASWRAQPGMLGLRFTFHRPYFFPLLTEGRADWVWEEAEQHGVPVMMLVPHALAHHVERIAARHPALRIVMDHLGLTEGKDAQAFAQLDRLLALARYPNVAVKASCLPFFSTEPYPYRGLHPYLRQVYDRFGPRRMFWGSDLSRLPCSYRQCVTLFTEEIPWLEEEDKEWILGRGLCEWIGWPLPER